MLLHACQSKRGWGNETINSCCSIPPLFSTSKSRSENFCHAAAAAATTTRKGASADMVQRGGGGRDGVIRAIGSFDGTSPLLLSLSLRVRSVQVKLPPSPVRSPDVASFSLLPHCQGAVKCRLTLSKTALIIQTGHRKTLISKCVL